VNGQEENRRGRKLRSGDVVEIEGFERLVIATAKRI
jgi:ribosome-associated protein YbcJ (S4-like RNA binding protein)